MAKSSGPTPDDIMAPAAMKPILMKSKQEPVSCALALTGDKLGVLLLHKKAKPRKLMGTLKSEASRIKLNLEASTIRFGRVEVDPDVDATLVTFRVNKEVPGTFDTKFRERVKQAGFSKAQFIVDVSLNEEPEEEAAEGTGAAADTKPGAEPEADWSGLASTLAGLIGGIKAAVGSDASLLGTLSKLASDASGAVKSKLDYAAAQLGVESLHQALSALPAPRAEVRAGTVAFAKSRLAWLATRKKVESDLQKLQSEIVATYADEGMGQELASAFTSWVGPVLSALDERLADALDAARNAADEGERAKLVAEARSLISEYTSFLHSDNRIAELDGNPFMPMAIRSIVGGTLSTLAKAIN